MELIAKALDAETIEEIAESLFGDAGYEISKALTDEQKKARRDKALQNTAILTNTVGGVAGPAAVGLAYRARKTGGMPREGTKTVAPKMVQSKRPKVRSAGKKLQNVANTLDAPKSRNAKIAAGAAGTGLVGMQLMNWGGDMLSAKLINDQKKKDAVGKRHEPTVNLDPRPVRAARTANAVVTETAQKTPVLIPKVKRAGQKIKEVKKEFDITWQGEIAKMDTEKRQVFGWASIIEIDGKPVVDLQGDIMDLDTIEKAAYEYVVSSRKGGNQHAKTDTGPKHVSDLVESFVITPEKKEQMGLPDDVPTGWWVGFKVNDEETWRQVKNGERKEFSIHGAGVRKSVEIDD
jgi:hypothetical protein